MTDVQTVGPGIQLGIFLCMRCASLHRKLGTHISKVKSLSMDSWSNEQVDSMKRNGNVNTNRTFNPQNTKPPIPLDVDEVDAVLERFIRQKYDQQVFSSGRAPPAARNNTGSTRSSEDQPPPLPPKPAKRFGFGLRSTSSAVNMQRSLPASPPLPPNGTNGFGGSPSPIHVNKQSRVFGASVGGGGGEMDSKLAQLRDMGFTDEKHNATVLKGLGGNLERTIESLVRLGEGSVPASRSRTPNPRNTAVSQPSPASNQSTGVINGTSFTDNGALSQTNTGSQPQQSFQNLNPTQPQPTSSNPFQQQFQSYNPFGIPSSQQPANVPLENAFAGMQISQQPLFPNATGGYPSQPQPPQEARFQTMTPPVPQVPQQYMQSNPYVQQSPAPTNNYNPFFQNQQISPAWSDPYASNVQIQTQDTQYQQNSYQHAQNSQPLYNGYTAASPQTQSPQVQQGSFQQQQSQSPQTLQGSFQQPPVRQQPVQQQSAQQHQITNPYQPQQPQQQQVSNRCAPQQTFVNPGQYPMQQPQPPQQYNSFQPSQLQTQQTGRVDKSSILALYNYPQLAPPPTPIESNATSPVEAPNPNKTASAPQRSVTMPVQLSTGSGNPFQSATANSNAAQRNGAYRHTSQESVDVAGFQNGRHSPDAFASLSARFVR
ncbi:hypothetical protein OEA41_000375 [Lepraria neglecta]|uniref:Uncharacterized protein n=1 Tax=Lepraria neglecta TaxID=209136 RepID=A0AAE0DPR2_9LECA|nr:hypothetical protein OEA41_000375 [Lepraria neglecta]